MVGARPLPVLQLGLGDGGLEVDVPEGRRLGRVGLARGPACAGSPAARPAGRARRSWCSTGSSRPTARAGATAPRRPARPRPPGARTARRSWAARRRPARWPLARPPSAGGCEVGVVRAGTGRSGRRSSSAPAARWPGRCRPSPSGRRPGSPASACSGRWCRCGCRRTRGRRGATRSPSAAACRWSRPAPAWPCGRSGRSPSASQRGAPLVLEALQGRFIGDGRGHDPATVLACCACYDTALGAVAPLELREPGRAVDVRVRADRLRRPPHRPRPLHAGLGRPPPLPGLVGPRGPLRLERDRHRGQDHRPGHAEGRPPGGGGGPLRAGVVGRPWTASASSRPTETPHATAYVEPTWSS